VPKWEKLTLRLEQLQGKAFRFIYGIIFCFFLGTAISAIALARLYPSKQHSKVDQSNN
jgi:type IV secretory pathway component VirB8